MQDLTLRVLIFLFAFSEVESTTSSIKHIKIETSSENNANCDKCLKLEVCQSGSCCETRNFHPIHKGEIKSLSNHELKNCKDFSIDETLAIEFTFNHQKNNDDWKGVEATVHLHQHEQEPYVCPISTWLNNHDSYHTTCESPFTVSQIMFFKLICKWKASSLFYSQITLKSRWVVIGE